MYIYTNTYIYSEYIHVYIHIYMMSLYSVKKNEPLSLVAMWVNLEDITSGERPRKKLILSVTCKAKKSQCESGTLVLRAWEAVRKETGKGG